MKTNTLKYTVVKSFREKGITYKVITTIKLHDECKNGTCSWSMPVILQQKKGNGRFVSGKILKRDYRIIWQRIVIATAALCGMFIFMMAIQLMCWLSNLCNYVFR